MPLHDWTEPGGWEGLRHLWITELLRWVKPRLPEGYRAYIGSAPLLAVGAPSERPDVGVRAWTAEPATATDARAVEGGIEGDPSEPDLEVAVATIDPGTALFVESQGRLITAVELISPRNKDRPVARAAYLSRYLGYLLDAVNLVLIDVHRRPLAFSFADRIAEELGLAQPSCPPPMAISYRVGEPAPSGGRLLALWRRPLTFGAALPWLPLPLTVEQAISIDLEHTYALAAADAYLT
jgi:Protein of unknown function (DUF4058)